ncbi:MAG: hypothetical protein HKN33_03200 [Pyrinomonadaceae bacterium]|nr:hypothetical protein [Pyrinomonadaceae bacterium]
MNEAVLMIHLFSTLFLVGLIWTIQIVHYPLFGSIGENEYRSYQRLHTRRIAYLVAPVMLAELISAIYLVIWPFGESGRWPFWMGFVLVIMIWVSTLFLQSPIHGRLSKGLDLRDVKLLTATNWIRTVLWTTRGFLVLWLVWPGNGG